MFGFKCRQCRQCKGDEKVMGAGMLEKDCQACRYTRYLRDKNIVIKKWFLSNPFKTTPVMLSLIIAALVLAIYLISIFINHSLAHNPALISLLVASLGWIFIALKYRLDQANYHKDLFEKRYAIFSVIDEVMWEWAQTDKVTAKMQNKISLDILRRSYFLFGENTHKFIIDFRSALSILSLFSNHELDTHHSIFKENFGEDLGDARYFLRSMLERNNLSDKFPELKIDTY